MKDIKNRSLIDFPHLGEDSFGVQGIYQIDIVLMAFGRKVVNNWTATGSMPFYFDVYPQIGPWCD